jgi:hypothetical protein
LTGISCQAQGTKFLQKKGGEMQSETAREEWMSGY